MRKEEKQKGTQNRNTDYVFVFFLNSDYLDRKLVALPSCQFRVAYSPEARVPGENPQGEHANATQRSPWPQGDLDAEPSFCVATILTL